MKMHLSRPVRVLSSAPECFWVVRRIHVGAGRPEGRPAIGLHSLFQSAGEAGQYLVAVLRERAADVDQ